MASIILLILIVDFANVFVVMEILVDHAFNDRLPALVLPVYIVEDILVTTLAAAHEPTVLQT